MAVVAASLMMAGSASAQSGIQGPLKIAVVGPFSGRGAEAGERVASAVRMAVEEVNAAGGLGGVKVDVVIGDDEGVPEKSTLVAQRMADDPAVLGVIGPMNSGAVLAAGSIYERAGLPFITPTATNARVTEQGWKMAHRLAGRDDREGPASAIFIAEEIKPKKVLLISDKTAFQAGIVQEVQRVLKQRGVSDATIEEVSDQDRDLTPLITRIKASGADFIYLGMTAPQAALFMKQAAQGGLKVRGLGNGSLRERDSFVKAAGGDAEGIFVSYNAQDPRAGAGGQGVHRQVRGQVQEERERLRAPGLRRDDDPAERHQDGGREGRQGQPRRRGGGDQGGEGLPGRPGRSRSRSTRRATSRPPRSTSSGSRATTSRS